MKYEDIKDSLSAISDINGQMKKLRSLCELEDNDINQREKIREFIENILKELYPECTAHLFGSSVNGLGFKGSDIDVYVGSENIKDIDTNIQRQLKMGRQILDKLQNCQKSDMNELHGIEGILSATVPIIKFVHSKSGIECDLSFSNRRALINSRFIKMCLEVDSRIRLLMTTIKYWAMHHKLSGSGDRNVMINNYAICLMVIFYLQSENILPSVKKLQQHMDASESVSIKVKGKKVAYGFPNDLSKWRCNEIDLSENSKSLTELLYGFFDFYANFDYLNSIISPNNGLIIPRDSKKNRNHKNPLCIEDPFDTNFDVTKNYKADFWKHSCKATEKIIAKWLVDPKKTNFLEIFEPIPKTELAMILQPKLEGASDEAAKSIQSLNDFCIESSLPVAKFYIVEYNSSLDETPENEYVFNAKVGSFECSGKGKLWEAKANAAETLEAKLRALSLEDLNTIKIPANPSITDILGHKIMIKRSSGSIHSAYLTSINLKAKSLTVEWADEESVKKRVKNIKLGSTFKSLNPKITFEDEEASSEIISIEEKTKVTMVELKEVKDEENVAPEISLIQNEVSNHQIEGKNLENDVEMSYKTVDDITTSICNVDIIDSEI